jgi:hypothetical protein
VGKVGEGEAASLAALNAIACLRKGVCMQPLSDAKRNGWNGWGSTGTHFFLKKNMKSFFLVFGGRWW